MAQTSPRADPHLLLLVEEELRATNPFIIAYKTMGEVWRELVHKSLQENSERPKDLVMLLSKAGDPMVALGPNQEILEPITRTEFAAIYNGEVAPQSPTHVVYMRGRVHNMPLQSGFTFPFLFPLLFPHGTIIWRPEMQLTPVIRPGGRRPRNAAAIPPAPPAAAADLPPGILDDAVDVDNGDDNDDDEGPPPQPNVAPRNRHRYKRLSFKAAVINYMQRRRVISNLHLSGRLAQVFTVYSSVRHDDMLLDYCKRNQHKIRFLPRCDLVQALNDQARLHNVTPGKLFIIPDSFKRSSRAFAAMFRDQMEIMRNFGTPDLFITATINRKWSELTENKLLFPNEGSDNLDILNRLLHLKLKRYLWLLTNGFIFGPVKHVVYTIEFQNRGGTHLHMLVTLERKLDTPRAIDEVVSATIPIKGDDPELYSLVTTSMMHTRCSPKCAAKGVSGCAKGFPFAFSDETIIHAGSHVVTYKRPDDGRFLEVNGVRHTNRSVATYNAFTLKFFGSHANCQIVTSVQTVAYILSYIFKGVDKGSMRIMTRRYPGFNPNEPLPLDATARDMRRRADLHRVNFFFTTNEDRATNSPSTTRHDLLPADIVNGHPRDDNQTVYLDYDEIQASKEIKVVVAADGDWNLKARHIFQVQLLLVHEEGKESVRIFNGNILAAEQRVQQNTTLTGFFKVMNDYVPGTGDINIRTLTYDQMPALFRWSASDHAWIRRTRQIGAKTLGRMAVINPRGGDLFYLRMLLKNVPEPRGFRDLRTVGGVTFETYKDAARQLHLLRDDAQYYRAMEEVRALGTADRLRGFLVTVLMMCELDEPLALMNHFLDHLTADWVRQGMTRDAAERKLRRFVARRLTLAGVVHIPELLDGIDLDFQEDVRFRTPDEPRALGSNDPPMTAAEARADFAKLNDEQQDVVRAITVMHDNYVADRPRETRAIFLSGPAGTGKSRVITHIDHEIRRRGGIVVKVAPTGMAANNIGGRTAHSAFGLPLNLTSTSSSSMTSDQRRWQLLRSATLIIFDELAMASHEFLRILHEILLDMHYDRNAPMPRNADPTDWPPLFAGVPILLTGDFRQAGPVATHGRLMQDLHIRNWEHFHRCRVMTLKKNMRAAEDKHFADWLLRLGEGRIADTASKRENFVKLPSQWMVHTLDDLITAVFGNNIRTADADRCIVTMRNKVCGNVNNHILALLPGQVVEKLSTDDFVEDDFGRAAPRNAAANVANRVDPARLNEQMEWMGGQITVDMLNQCTPSGKPEHRLRLKKDCILMLLRNLDIDAGLCNGTRLCLKGISENTLHCIVVSGASFGQDVFIPRIDTISSFSANVPFRRNQFPVRLAWCCTVMKMQGQTLARVGVYLEKYLFQHGLLYVAFSRVRSAATINVLMGEHVEQGYDEVNKEYFTFNKVDRQIWNLSQPRRVPSTPSNVAHGFPAIDPDDEAVATNECGPFRPTVPDELEPQNVPPPLECIEHHSPGAPKPT
ncbi:Hypothetical predicted protein [Cloeon dipterum]|uniref:ATP-dependent DNA helicase n=1 Tax=Cloeon dipterum TaxID=197152 RepID=A0A8S1E2G9_9INSE|nr:Hypothetical predicted protein [Cloeon dipterum]